MDDREQWAIDQVERMLASRKLIVEVTLVDHGQPVEIAPGVALHTYEATTYRTRFRPPTHKELDDNVSFSYRYGGPDDH